MAKAIADGLEQRIAAGDLGLPARIKRLRVLLHESHAARAWYETDL